MAKKAASKKKVKKKTAKHTKVKKKTQTKPTEVRYHSTKEVKVEKALIENFIGLQKVLVNMSSKFDDLSTQMSRLLNLFEVSAKAMAKKEFAMEGDPDVKKIMERLDNLNQQAGLIGRGLTLIHEINEERTGHKKPTHFEPQPSPMRPQMRNPGFVGNKPVPPNQLQPSIMKPQQQNSPPMGIKKPMNKKPESSSRAMEIGENTKTSKPQF